MKVFIVGIALLIGATAVRASHPEPRVPSSFSLVLEPTPNGWSARCDSGCRWSAASFGCASACNAIVDANGLVTVATPRAEPTAFSFQVERTLDGVQARALVGTAWKTLSWTCDVSPCRVRIDSHGVSGARDRR